jgi:hypothetical protein
MKVLFLFIFFSICFKGISQNIPEFKIEKEGTTNDSTAPKALNLKDVKEQIKYPDSAKVHGIEGSVKARLFIDEKGEVKKIDEIKGHTVFYEVVKNACLKLKFSPAHHHNKPISCYVIVPFKFTIPEKTDSAKIDSNRYRDTSYERGFSIPDVNYKLILWTIFIFLLPIIAVAIVLILYYKKKRKNK